MQQHIPEYGRHGSIRRERVAVFAVLFGVLCIVGWAIAPWCLGLVSNRLPYLADQKLNLNLTFPSDDVAFEEDPAHVKALTQHGRRGDGWIGVKDLHDHVAFYERVAEHLQRRTWTGTPTEFPSLGRGLGALFVHGRRATGGPERLVIVQINPQFEVRSLEQSNPVPPRYPEGLPVIDWTVMEPAGVFTPPAILHQGNWRDSQFNMQMEFPATIYSGQIDPKEPAHFTIRFKTSIRSGTIDGRLTDDDQVVLNVVESPKR